MQWLVLSFLYCWSGLWCLGLKAIWPMAQWSTEPFRSTPINVQPMSRSPQKIGDQYLKKKKKNHLNHIIFLRPDNEEVWPVFRLSYMYFGLLGSLIVLLVGIPVSYLDDSKRKPLHHDLFCPLVHSWLPNQLERSHPTEVTLLQKSQYELNAS